MTRLEHELARRLAILERSETTEPAGRHLPRIDALVLAALTMGSLCAVWIAQAL